MNEIETLKQRIAVLENIVLNGEFPDKKLFDKVVVGGQGFRVAGNAVITGGAATTNASIKLDVGTLPKGSIYISSNGNGEIWVMQTSTWTKVTIP